MNDWNIQSRAHECQACQQTFSDKQLYHTLLFDERHAYVRRDICDGCWTTDFKDQERVKGFISYWQGTYEAPPAAPPEVIQKETAETLLRKLIDLNQERYTAAGYILAVMLERKRLLKVKEQLKRDGQRWFVYEHPKSGDLFTIADPQLQLTQLEEVQRIVADLLEFGLTPEGEIARPAAPEPAGEGVPQPEAASAAPEDESPPPEESLGQDSPPEEQTPAALPS